MLPLELAIIDVRNFKEVRKFVLKAGLNIFQGGNGSGKTTLWQILYDLFYPGYEHYSQSRSSQAALLFRMNDGQVYRLVRNFSKGAGHFYQLDPSKKLALIEKEESGLAERIRRLINPDSLPEEAFKDYFFLNRNRLPSFHGASGISGGRINPLPAAAPRMAPGNSVPVSDERMAARLRELRELALKADLLARKESDLLDMKDKVYNIKRSLGELETAKADLARIEEKEAAFAGFHSVPRDTQQILDEYENNQAEKMVEQGELTEDIALIEQQLQMDQRNLLQNKLLWGGGVLAVLSLILGLILELEGPERYVQGLVLVIGIGLVGYALYQDLMRASQKKTWKAKLENKNKNLEILTARFRRENTRYFDLLEKTGTENRETFETRFMEFRSLMGEKQEAAGRIERNLAGRSLEDLEQEMIDYQTKIQAIAAEIATAKPGVPDSYTVQNEIREIEERLNPGLSISGGSSLDHLTGGPSMESTPAPEVPGVSRPGLESFFEKDWGFLTASAGLTEEQITQFLQKRLSTLCGDRLKINVMPGGKIEFEPGIDTLSSGILDFLFIGMFLIRSQFLRKVPFPLVLDDPMVTLDSELQGTLINFAKDISRGRVILLFSHTGHPVENANIIKI